ncbi:Serine/threonine-protein kinase STY8 [Hypsizygus marmoreus]|uniref:Serine/threonine-protein kinase STY8 n=1 Tax=Hypsizygus marmoreus TaxID=39966 RepID=A0A369K1Q5_HYPMA|nr:Serine/threonine-protein kinase STY8 [Hypsizygus marmoreus]
MPPALPTGSGTLFFDSRRITDAHYDSRDRGQIATEGISPRAETLARYFEQERQPRLQLATTDMPHGSAAASLERECPPLRTQADESAYFTSPSHSDASAAVSTRIPIVLSPIPRLPAPPYERLKTVESDHDRGRSLGPSAHNRRGTSLSRPDTTRSLPTPTTAILSPSSDENESHGRKRNSASGPRHPRDVSRPRPVITLPFPEPLPDVPPLPIPTPSLEVDRSRSSASHPIHRRDASRTHPSTSLSLQELPADARPPLSGDSTSRRSPIPASAYRGGVSRTRPGATLQSSDKPPFSPPLPPTAQISGPGALIPTMQASVSVSSGSTSRGRKTAQASQSNKSTQRDKPSNLPLPTRSMSRPRPFLLPPKGADAKATFVNGIGEHSQSPDRSHFGTDHPFLQSRPATPESSHLPDPYPFLTDRPATPTPLSPANIIDHESGRRSARGFRHSMTPRPGAGESLHRLVLSPTRVQQLQTSVENKKPVVNNEKLFTVLTEDEDGPLSPVHHNALEHNRRLLRTPRQSEAIRHADSPVPQPFASPALSSLFPNTEDMDSFVLSSAMAVQSSSVARPSTGGIARQIISICTYLMDVFRDLNKYKQFLSYRDEAAQSVLNFMQTLLDYAQLEERFRTIFFVALLRLSRKADLYPQCFTLTDVIREGEYPISDGHFGEVYRGYFRGIVVALKLIKTYADSTPVAFRAFSREGVLWGQLSHINVLPFYGIYRLGDSRNRIGLVSPWMENGNVNEFLRKNPDADRRLLVSDVASGMLYLHQNGVIHGDFKGSNILVTDSKRACLADFGLSVVTDVHGLKTPSLSSANPEGGTVRFQAPELIDPEFEHPRSMASDVYAFSLVCYEIFTGDHPFPDVKSDHAVLLKVSRGERPAKPLGLHYLDRGLTDRMWRLMEDCWEHIPDLRPPASEIVERLQRGPSVDPREEGGWGDLSPSRFRVSHGLGHSEQQDLSVEETLRVLETSGISLFQL